ncbi:MAG: VOC family protein [Culicoidibacterales bacterium]
MIHSTFHHLCIQTNNYPASLAFYHDILGAKIVQETQNFHGRAFNSWLDFGTFMIELQTPKQSTHFSEFCPTTEGLAHFCLLVDDVKATVAFIQATGYNQFKLKNQAIIYNVEGSLLAKIIAPEGTIIELRDQATL